MDWIKIIIQVIVDVWEVLTNKKKEQSQKPPEEIKKEEQEVDHAVDSNDPSEITRIADRVRNSRR